MIDGNVDDGREFLRAVQHPSTRLRPNEVSITLKLLYGCAPLQTMTYATKCRVVSFATPQTPAYRHMWNRYAPAPVNNA